MKFFVHVTLKEMKITIKKTILFVKTLTMKRKEKTIITQ